MVFQSGLRLNATSVIAADGIRSAVRRMLFDETEPVFTGANLIYAKLPGLAGVVKQEPEAFHLVLADDFSVLTSHYLGKEPETWFAVLTRTDAPLFGRGVWTGGKSGLSAGAEELLDSNAFLRQYTKPAPNFIYSGALFTRDLEPGFQWNQGPVLLIGDAVHGLTPWGGYSGQMAVEDAFVVAEYLGEPANFAQIQARRVPRVLQFQSKSADQHSGGLGDEDGVKAAQRSRVLELITCPAFCDPGGHDSLLDEPAPWVTPDLSAEGLVQTDLKLMEAGADPLLRATDLAEQGAVSGWLEIGRRALTDAHFPLARFAGEVLEAYDPELGRSGKLWFAAVACFFTGHWSEGKLRFDAEMGQNEVDAEELLWRELCCMIGGIPRVYAGTQLGQCDDPRPVFNLIQEVFALRKGASELLAEVRSPGSSAHDRFYAHFYCALFAQATAAVGLDAHALLAEAQRFGCRDNLGLVASKLSILPAFTIDTGNAYSYSCPRLIVGCAGMGPTPVDIAVLQDSARFGMNCVDVADIYPGAEELACSAGNALVHTKYVPDHNALGSLGESDVQCALARSKARLGRTPHAVQLHWWGEIEEGVGQLAKVAALLESSRLSGQFRALGVTNMDREHIDVVRQHARVSLAQVSFSLIDRRALQGGLAKYLRLHDIRLVAYGALAGGFLADRWLGAAEPCEVPPPKRKYFARIQAQGGWGQFQALLTAVSKVARRKGISVSQLALAFALHHASGVIVGLGSDTTRTAELAAALRVSLTAADIADMSQPAHADTRVYGDERNASHPIGQALLPWRDTSHLGPPAADEAVQRAQQHPTRQFVADELRLHLARENNGGGGKGGGAKAAGLAAALAAAGAAQVQRFTTAGLPQSLHGTVARLEAAFRQQGGGGRELRHVCLKEELLCVSASSRESLGDAVR
jgi:aryl-alcohol dehydrogenase-like predicted oxidoreductase